MKENSASIVSQQRFLTEAQCAELIVYMVEALPERAVHGPNTIFSGRYIDKPPHPVAEAAAKRAATLVGLAFDTKLAVETFQLVVWPEGSEQPVHIDKRRPLTTHAAIAYLNDDFEGGQTYFPDIEEQMQPERGTLIAFPGRALPHGVRRIDRGIRYTLALWFVPG